jgi:hypothetical protein
MKPSTPLTGKNKKMEVTLRKAASLEKSLQEAARSQSLVKALTISVFSPKSVSDEVVPARAKLATNLSKALSFISAAFQIREAIKKANATNGIDGLLAEKASFDAREKLISGVVSANVIFDDGETDSSVDQAQARLDSLKERQKTADRFAQDSVTVNIVNQDLTAQFQDQLTTIRKRKVEITDQLLILNMTKKITLTVETVALLTELKLI